MLSTNRGRSLSIYAFGFWLADSSDGIALFGLRKVERYAANLSQLDITDAFGARDN